MPYPNNAECRARERQVSILKSLEREADALLIWPTKLVMYLYMKIYLHIHATIVFVYLSTLYMLYTTWVIWREFGIVSMDAVCGAPWRICELKARHAYVIMMTPQKH